MGGAAYHRPIIGGHSGVRGIRPTKYKRLPSLENDERTMLITIAFILSLKVRCKNGSSLGIASYTDGYDFMAEGAAK